ncbi:hypothetical protein [Caulobacter sp. S45]|uniref:hypothetical protein n=1 Tax=Caulobacter sp. S45 TaxID=1641861 RepID=UPI0020C70234|nr:hypothetical protein [Caulobacter sp. S45]
MNDAARWTDQGLAVRGRTYNLTPALRSGMAGVMGGLVMILALAVGVAIAVVFAATLAVIMALATALLALSALAWRMRPRSAARRAVLAVRHGGHAWVAYSWDRPSR